MEYDGIELVSDDDEVFSFIKPAILTPGASERTHRYYGRSRLNKTQQRNKAKFDPLYLSELLGYDFHIVNHGLELLRSVGPDLTESDKLGEPNPLLELSDMKNRMVLWSRGHFKTSAVVLKIVQLILAYPDIRILLMQATVKNTKGLLREVKSHFNA